MLNRRKILGAAGSLAIMAIPGIARAGAKPIKIGVLSDMSGPFSADTGPGSMVSAKLAVDDFMKTNPGFKVELISGDMQSKPNLCASISSSWYEWEGVDAIVDVPISSGAFAVAGTAKKLNKVALLTTPGSSDLTGKACGPNHVQWVFDTYGNAHSIARVLLDKGKNTWFFIQADYAFGEALVRDASAEIAAARGAVVGVVKHPSPNTSDFSSFLLQALVAKPKVLALANSSTEASNCLKQSLEFGLNSQMTIAALTFAISQTHAIGLGVAKGLILADTFYWNLNPATRAFSDRWTKQLPRVRPNSYQAGVYSAIMHYLKAVSAVGANVAKSDGAAVIRKMKEIPTDDPIFGKGVVRADGRKIHNYYLFQVKSQSQSKGPWDYYNLIRTVPGDQAFRPMSAGGCSLV